MNLRKFAKTIRLSSLQMAYKAGKNGSHLGAGLSAVEIFAAFYRTVLSYNINNPEDDCRDGLVLR